MPTTAYMRRLQKTRLELALLLAASLASVVVLTIGIVGSKPTDGAETTLAGQLLLVTIVAGAALLTLFLVVQTATSARRRAASAEAEAKQLSRSLLTAEALIKAEPQILLYWEHGHGLSIVTQTLSGIPGLPTNQPELLRFGLWLEQKSAQNLKTALDALFGEGRAFNLILKTVVGGHLEADGRAAGRRAVLRLRDVAGYKRDLSTILDQHAKLARDVRSSRALLDALPSPTWLRGPDGHLAWVNKAYVQAVEAASETDVIAGQIELLESRQRRTAEKTLKSQPGYRERLPLIVQGQRKSHDVTILTLGDATAGAAISVAELETAKGELDRQIAAYDRTLDHVATAVAIFNPEQRLVFFNEAFQKLWQIDQEWLGSGPSNAALLDRLRELGRLPSVVQYRDWQQKLLATYKTGQSQEDWWHLPDGRVVHMMAEQRPDGGVTCLFDDESERLAQESRYNALIRVQSETLNSLKEGVAVFGTDGRLTLFNQAFSAIWKLSPRRLGEGPHIDEFIRDASVLYTDPMAWERIGRTVTSFTDDRRPLEGQMVRPDNTVIDYAASPLPDGGTLLTFADVTDAKRYERALVERNEALVAADRLKDQFISNVSYELRSPLQNIIGYSEMLAQPFVGVLNERQREYLDAVSSSSKTLKSLINDILDLATIDAGSLKLKLAEVPVRAVIDGAIMGIRERVERAGLVLDVGISEESMSFVADEARVRQVLFNLLSNAVGFSKTGDVIEISCWRDDGYMVFEVRDHGVGIPPEQQERIFGRFESRSQGSKHRGAGLGLAIVQNLVKLHGGDIELDSQLGRGTRVRVRFPERGKAPGEKDLTPAHDVSVDRNAS